LITVLNTVVDGVEKLVDAVLEELEAADGVEGVLVVVVCVDKEAVVGPHKPQ
jgi:hypothetical protein